MKKSIIEVVAWISTATAVSIAVYVTNTATPLIAMLVPVFITNSDEEKIEG